MTRTPCAVLSLLLLLLLLPRSDAGRSRKSPQGASVPLEDLIVSLAQVPALGPSLRLSASASDATPRSRRVRQRKLFDGDFVYATGSCRERMHLAKSTRAWRRGLRGFILTDQNNTESLRRLNAEGAAHNESYAFFPDDGDPLLGGVRHGTKLGDTRAAVAPFAAHRHYGETYKWLLYGDDDTLFFLEPIKRMLSSYDHNLPLAFSDNLWYFGQQPNPHAPRCLPCDMANEALPSLETILNSSPTRETFRKYLSGKLMGATDADLDAAACNATDIPGRLFVPRPACPYCTPTDACPLVPKKGVSCNPSVAHGGTGMIFSVGLLRSIAYAAALQCVRSFRRATGGDFIVSSCLWQHGIAFTDPGPLVRHLYDPHYHTFGGKAGLGYLWDPIGMMAHGRCNATCRWMLRNTLTLHLKSRHFRSWRVSSILMWGVAHATQAAQSFLEVASRDGGASWKNLPYGVDLDDAAGFAAYEAASLERE